MSTAAVRAALAANLDRVERRLADACSRAGRKRDEVTLVAVTKTVTAEVAGLLPGLGVLDLGENRPQELWRKAEALPREVRWHMIGHLQRNKIDRTLPLVRRVHAVDSLRLLEAIEEFGGEASVMLEINCSGEASKQGFDPSAIDELVAPLRALSRARVVGLMTMAAPEDDPERCRPTFALLRQLRDRLREQVGDRHRLAELSMGMSGDFEIAVEEGATHVRLGSVLFEGLPGPE